MLRLAIVTGVLLLIALASAKPNSLPIFPLADFDLSNHSYSTGWTSHYFASIYTVSTAMEFYRTILMQWKHLYVAANCSAPAFRQGSNRETKQLLAATKQSVRNSGVDLIYTDAVDYKDPMQAVFRICMRQIGGSGRSWRRGL